jgi:hypothetical protein
VNASPFRTMLTGLESSFQTPAIDGKAAGFSGGRVTDGGGLGAVLPTVGPPGSGRRRGRS